MSDRISLITRLTLEILRKYTIQKVSDWKIWATKPFTNLVCSLDEKVQNASTL